MLHRIITSGEQGTLAYLDLSLKDAILFRCIVLVRLLQCTTRSSPPFPPCSCKPHTPVRLTAVPDSPARPLTPTKCEVRVVKGWGYLAVVLDLCSRRVIGWAFANHMRNALFLGALNDVLVTRRENNL